MGTLVFGTYSRVYLLIISTAHDLHWREHLGLSCFERAEDLTAVVLVSSGKIVAHMR